MLKLRDGGRVDVTVELGAGHNEWLMYDVLGSKSKMHEVQLVILVPISINHRTNEK